jgi:hypothetical protein
MTTWRAGSVAAAVLVALGCAKAEPRYDAAQRKWVFRLQD